jgi:single-stranded DNA-binding protein
MDFNVVVLAGRLAAEPEIRTFESGTTLLRLLVTVRSSEPRSRLDVIPVVKWNPHPELIPDGPVRGRAVWVVGATQRRFWSAEDGRHSRIEIVANIVEFRPEEVAAKEEVPNLAACQEPL